MGLWWLTLCCVVSGWMATGQFNELSSICQSSAYRSLPAELQNEHQCMVLERLQFDLQIDKSERDRQMTNLLVRLDRMGNKMARGLSRINSGSGRSRARGFPALKDITIARDCNELLMSGVNVSGVYPLKMPSGYVVNVWCDMDTDNGGWTVIQRRQDGSVNFTRNWDDYAFGFGNVNTEFWLGNENIHLMTINMHYTLRIDLWDWEDNTAHAQYDLFEVSTEKEKYRMNVEGYDGTAGDSLKYHSGMKFSTPERDNDLWYASCSQKDQAGWWYNACSFSALNGIYHHNGEKHVTPDGMVTGITWFAWKKDPSYSMMKTEMKIKPRTAILAEKDKQNRRPAVG